MNVKKTPLLDVRSVTKTYGSFVAVNNWNLQLNKGNCCALLGPNGAGKTTIIRMLAGLLTPSSGSIRIGEAAVDSSKERPAIGYLPQHPAFYNWMTGREFVVYAGRISGLAKREASKVATDLLDRVGLTHAAGRRIGGYSGGMKQRLGLAQALVHDPVLLLMDEPVAALDPIGRREFLQLLHSLKSERTILFSTHVLHDAEELCDELVIMSEGQTRLKGNIAQLKQLHGKPQLTLYFEGSTQATAWQKELQKRMEADKESLPIQQVIHQGTEVRLIVGNIDQARDWLWRELANSKPEVSRIDTGMASLEDLFVEVVSGHGQ